MQARAAVPQCGGLTFPLHAPTRGPMLAGLARQAGRRLAPSRAPRFEKPPPAVLGRNPTLRLKAVLRTMATGGHEFEYDLVTIGAGSGGVRTSRVSASKFGAKAAVVELPFGLVSSDEVGGAGGTCVIRGCVPKKLLVYASQFASEFRASQGFGWSSQTPPVDLHRLIERKDAEVSRLNGVYGGILSRAGVEQIEGRGVLLDPHTVEVRRPDGTIRRLRTKYVVVATGSRAVRPPIEGAELGLTSDDALVLDDYSAGVPVAIVGGGYIAVEFAGIFAGLGADAHIFYRRPAPLRGFDDECCEAVATNLELRGVKTHAKCHPTKLETVPRPDTAPTPTSGPDDWIRLSYRDADGSDASIVVAHVLFATGRRPNSRGLGLEDAGVELDPKSGAVVVDKNSKSSVDSIYAVGDVTDRVNLTPVALKEGAAVAATLFGDDGPKEPDYEYVPSAVFCQPPLATVGYTEAEAVERFAGPIEIYTSRFRPMRNTLSGSEERTFMKMVVHAQTRKVLGCHMVGDDAAEIVQGLAVALKAGATKDVFDSTVGIHPSSAEEFVTMSTVTRVVEGKGAKTP